MQQQQVIRYAITGVVIAIVLAIRWRRTGRSYRLRLETLWVVPAIYVAMVAAMFATHPPHGPGWALCGVALVLGAAIGWQRGRMMAIEVDPATHQLNQRSSPAALLIIVVLIAVRSGARTLLADGGGAMHLDPMVLTDVLLAMALGLFATQRLEMFLRARTLLAAARAGGQPPAASSAG